MKYAVYDSKGQILRTGNCPDSMILEQAGDGENVMEVPPEVSDARHKIIGGQVVDKTPEEIEIPDPRGDLIRAKECEILRRMAIEELTAEGKL